MYKKSYETLLDAHTKLKEGTLVKFQEIEIKDLQDQIAILKDLCKTHEHTCSKKSTINYHSWKPQLELFIRMRWNVGDIFTLQEFYYIYKGIEIYGIIFKLGASLISSVPGLNVTPKKVIFLFFKLFPKILCTLFSKRFFLLSLDFITLLTIERSTLYLSAVLIKALVSLGKHDPPYAGPALKNLSPIR